MLRIELNSPEPSRRVGERGGERENATRYRRDDINKSGCGTNFSRRTDRRIDRGGNKGGTSGGRMAYVDNSDVAYTYRQSYSVIAKQHHLECNLSIVRSQLTVVQ